MGGVRWAAGLALLALTACAPKEAPPDRLTLSPATFADLPGWTGDRVAEAVPALARSCTKIRTMPPDRALGIAGPAGAWAEPCAALGALPPGDDAAARAFFERWFTPFAAANNDVRRGLFTGYYEVELKGSRTPSAA